MRGGLPYWKKNFQKMLEKLLWNWGHRRQAYETTTFDIENRCEKSHIKIKAHLLEVLERDFFASITRRYKSGFIADVRNIRACNVMKNLDYTYNCTSLAPKKINPTHQEPWQLPIRLPFNCPSKNLSINCFYEEGLVVQFPSNNKEAT